MHVRAYSSQQNCGSIKVARSYISIDLGLPSAIFTVTRFHLFGDLCWSTLPWPWFVVALVTLNDRSLSPIVRHFIKRELRFVGKQPVHAARTDQRDQLRCERASLRPISQD
jgi:hypothetical protein